MSEPLTMEEIAKLRDWLSTRPDGKERRYLERLVATVEELMEYRQTRERWDKEEWDDHHIPREVYDARPDAAP